MNIKALVVLLASLSCAHGWAQEAKGGPEKVPQSRRK